MVVRERPLTVFRVLRQIPWLAGVVIVYAIIAAIDLDALGRQLLAITLPSGGIWSLTVMDLILLLGIIGLFAEILKATRTSRVSVADHALSMLTFIVCLILFLLWTGAATSGFFLLMWLTLTDVIAGFTVTLAGARRDIGLAGTEHL